MVKSERTTAWARTPAAKLFFAACGIAGCTAGPAISSISIDPPAAVQARVERRALAAGEAASRGRLAWPGLKKPSVRSVGHEAAAQPDDPFTAAASKSATVPAPAPAVRRAEVSAPQTAQEAPALEDASPVTAGVTRPFGQEPRAERLPPANPFGSRRRDADAARASALKPSADLSPVAATPTDSTPVGGRRTAAKPVSRATTPLDSFLADSPRTRPARAGRIDNEDMIVDSALLTKRLDRRHEIAAEPREERADFPITPRRPFSSPMWETASVTAPSAMANLPVSLEPSPPADAAPLSIANAMPVPVEIPAEPAMDSMEMPSVRPANENPFATLASSASNESFAAISAERRPVISAGPLFAPGPAATPALASVGAPAAAPVLAVATAKAEAQPGRLNDPGVAVRPVDLSGADRLQAQEASRPKFGFSTPLAVGLALAAVAIGTVMIRRRFA